jgi:hypothetical protein
MKKIECSYKEAKEIVYFARRNKKLVPNKNTKFLIWSLPAIETCPNACDACKYYCYARKSELAYPDCLPCRERNLKASMRADFVDVVTVYIRNAAKQRGYKDAKRVVVRIHESGDFYSQDYYNKWIEIANNCADIKNIVFMAYTKSVDFVKNGLARPANMVVRFSLWADTPDRDGNMLAGSSKEDIETAAALDMPIYSAVEEFTTESNKTRCNCVDCGICNKCWCEAIKLLLCEIH